MTWNEILGPVMSTPKLMEVKTYLQAERKTKNIYPLGKDVFKAFDACPYEDTKIVILGQDPYATPDTADGLAFSSKGKVIPPSLMVIFKEIYTDLNIQYFHNVTFEEFFPTPDLTNWTKLGILLLNTVLTVEENKPGSHKGIGWEPLIEAVFDALNKKDSSVVFLLWGNEAKEYKALINDKKHIILEAPHPAAELHNPDGPKFTSCRHFSIIRDIIPCTRKIGFYTHLNLDSCFDKEKAMKIAKEQYPADAEKICSYIKNGLILDVPINRESYHKELREIEKGFSTKTITK
jgi:uracil-DNA glycosylase